MIKEKLHEGTIFYKIYLYYQLYFRYKLFYKRKNYSQFDEDIFLVDFFKEKKNGKFVDLGAFHPMRYNNTYLLYKTGWSGTNIDLNQTAIDMFNIVRKRDNNKCALISNKSNEKKIVYYEHNFSAVNSLILTSELKEVLNKEKVMITKTFEELIEHNFDFLNIDLEGHDYEVLKNINFDKYRPKLVCVEILEKSKDKNNIFKFLKNKGYVFIKKCEISYFFENRLN